MKHLKQCSATKALKALLFAQEKYEQTYNAHAFTISSGLKMWCTSSSEVGLEMVNFNRACKTNNVLMETWEKIYDNNYIIYD